MVEKWSKTAGAVPAAKKGGGSLSPNDTLVILGSLPIIDPIQSLPRLRSVRYTRYVAVLKAAPAHVARRDDGDHGF